MKSTTITISQETKSKIESSKDKYGYKTFDDCLKSIWLYLESNDLNPTLPYSKDNYVTLETNSKLRHEEANKILKNEVQGLRKFIGALEKNYLKPIINKLEMEDVIKAVELSKPEKETPPALESLVKEQSSETDHLKSQISEIRNAKNEALNLAEKYKNMLKQLMTKIKVENNILGTKECQIKMSVSEYEEFKKSTGLV